jgi:hypothetical protein
LAQKEAGPVIGPKTIGPLALPFKSLKQLIEEEKPSLLPPKSRFQEAAVTT